MKSPIFQGKDAIFVVVDKLTNSAHFFPLTQPFSAKEVIHCMDFYPQLSLIETNFS